MKILLFLFTITTTISGLQQSNESISAANCLPTPQPIATDWKMSPWTSTVAGSTPALPFELHFWIHSPSPRRISLGNLRWQRQASISLPPRILRPLLFSSAPREQATDAYYQELLGISVTTLISLRIPLDAYSDCSSAIIRAHQALSPFGTSMGSLRHGSLLLGIRHMGASRDAASTLQWVPSHPERKKPQHSWTEDDWGMHMADEIAGFASGPLGTASNIQIFTCNSTEVHAALIPPGTWQWQEGHTPSMDPCKNDHNHINFSNTRTRVI
jgi:hypothetical protein